MEERTITDETGKVLLLRDLDVVEELDLYEVAGASSTNPAWLGTAMTACSVRAINGHPQPFPKTRDQIKAALTRIGREGVLAVRKMEREDAKAEEAKAAADLLVATQEPGALSPEDTVAKN
ncbi:MAG: hypothetical protein ACRYHQ_20085 [Janthinobacterium lividum]